MPVRLYVFANVTLGRLNFQFFVVEVVFLEIIVQNKDGDESRFQKRTHFGQNLIEKVYEVILGVQSLKYVHELVDGGRLARVEAGGVRGLFGCHIA